jgi:hypothetical protein
MTQKMKISSSSCCGIVGKYSLAHKRFIRTSEHVSISLHFMEIRSISNLKEGPKDASNNISWLPFWMHPVVNFSKIRSINKIK